jgi:hypothetical protein
VQIGGKMVKMPIWHQCGFRDRLDPARDNGSYLS